MKDASLARGDLWKLAPCLLSICFIEIVPETKGILKVQNPWEDGGSKKSSDSTYQFSAQ